MHYACGYGRMDAVQALIDAGADTDAKNDTGKTPLDLAKMDDRNPVGQNADLVVRLSS